MENELNKTIEESQRLDTNWDDDQDDINSCNLFTVFNILRFVGYDIDEFEQRLRESRMGFNVKQRDVKSAVQSTNKKDLNQQLQSKLAQQQKQVAIKNIKPNNNTQPIQATDKDKKIKDLQQKVMQQTQELEREIALRQKLEQIVKQTKTHERKASEGRKLIEDQGWKSKTSAQFESRTNIQDKTQLKVPPQQNNKIVEQLRSSLEQCKSDNDQLLQKIKAINQKKQAIEQELIETRMELDKMRKIPLTSSSNNFTLPKIEIKRNQKERLSEEQEVQVLQELRLLRIENEELNRIIQNMDQAKIIKDLTLQNAKQRSRIDDLMNGKR